MDVTREHISHIFELREILLSFQIGFSLINAAVVCAILESISHLVTNEEVCAKIQQAIGPHEDLTVVKRRKLQWYGHVSHSSGLAKTILQGSVKGGRRQGRQRKRWEDNIREWTGLEFTKSQKAVENMKKWRKWLQNHLVPQQPLWLRDRCDEMRETVGSTQGFWSSLCFRFPDELCCSVLKDQLLHDETQVLWLWKQNIVPDRGRGEC